MARMTLEERKENFLKKAREVHGDSYDYTKAIDEFKNNQTNVTIICPEHGEFKQKPGNHLYNKTGCPTCSLLRANKKKTYDITEFIEKARKVHGDKYDYSTVDYVKASDHVDITCPSHGRFPQTPTNHLQGTGCPLCAKEKKSKNSSRTFFERATDIHGDKYDYSLVEYKNAHTHVDILCPTHGVFSQLPLGHVRGFGCTKCTEWGYSKMELEILEYVESLGVTAIHKDRTTIHPKEIDIFIPEKSVGIEFNGLYWHSVDNPKEQKPIKYHQDKALSCMESGIMLINIWEDDWIDVYKREVVKKKIASKLGVGGSRVFARKTYVCDVSHKEATGILESNHIQGFHPSSSYVGLRRKDTDELVSVLGMRKRGDGVYELTRYATSCSVIGGFSKALSYWKRKNPSWGEIFTFAHLDYSHGGMYESTGFVKEHITHPGMWYCKGKRRYRRETFMKHKLKGVLEDFDPSLSERENMLNNGYFRVYDCGSIRYSMKNE